MNKQVVIVAVSSGVVGAALGSTVTYFLSKKRIQSAAYLAADAEIQSVKDTYKLLRKEPPYDDPRTAAKAYLERLDQLDSYVRDGVDAAEVAAIQAVNDAEEAVEDAEEDLVEAIEDADEVSRAADVAEDIINDNEYGAEPEERRLQVRNIFDESRQRAENAAAAERDEDRFDELQTRDPRKPYVITTDDFFDDSNEFTKITISYFEEDDTLCDDKENIIPNIEEAVGQANMLKFGEDSDDKNTVYIRNERLRVDYEVTREEGSYSRIVLGIREMDEVRDKRVKRMRDDE